MVESIFKDGAFAQLVCRLADRKACLVIQSNRPPHYSLTLTTFVVRTVNIPIMIYYVIINILT